MGDSTAIRFERPAPFRDELTELLRHGARQLVAQAVEAFGAERIAWGSNYPASGGLDEYVADLNLLLDGKLPVPDEAIEAIAGANMRRFWFG